MSLRHVHVGLGFQKHLRQCDFSITTINTVLHNFHAATASSTYVNFTMLLTGHYFVPSSHSGLCVRPPVKYAVSA
eukprot:4330481-Pleurochrysis_carterae.AAC.4